jgi:hypothetical protein
MDENAIQLYVELGGIQPKIWRRFIVGDMISFERLHRAIQAVMGWKNRHLFTFVLQDGVEIQKNEDNRYTRLPPAAAAIYKSPTNHRLYSFLKKPGDSFQYTYDFGDDWVHHLTVESISPIKPGQILPLCLEGARACPPEDCGGIPGYEHILKLMKKPKHKEYQETMNWPGANFDPEAFLLEKINKRLVRMRSRDY